MNRIRHRLRRGKVTAPLANLIAAAGLALSLLSSTNAQDIEIPSEFLEDDPPPLTIDPVTDAGTGASEGTGDAGTSETTIDLDELSTGDATETIPGIDLDELTVGDGLVPTDDGATSAGLKLPTVQFTTDFFTYLHAAEPGAGDEHLVRADLRLKFEGRIGDDIAYLVTPQLRQDSGDDGVNAFEFRENFERRPLATFQEAYLEWLGERFQVSVGKRIFNWGVSDAYNPIDDLNPRDYLDVPTYDRIGVPAISLYHLNDHFEFQAVWEPWFTPSRIPVRSDNRWRGDFRAQQRRAAAALGFPVRFRFGGRNLPADQFGNGQFGARLSSSTLINGWDLALTYFRGRHPEGVFVGTLMGPTLVATLEFPRYQEFGASFATVVGPWQIHGEGSWHITDSEMLDDDFLEWVVGVNRSFSDLPIPGVEELRLILEYAGQAVTRDLPSGSPSFGSRRFSRPFEDAVVASLTFKFSEDTELECSGAYDFADRGSIFEASVSHDFSANVEVELGTNFFSGPENSFFGKWDANDRIFLTIALVY